MKEILDHLINYRSLDREKSKEVLTNLAQGNYNQSQVAAFLTVFMMRTITVEELAGFREAMLELCLYTDLSEFDAMDLCGTGGDGKDTFNISTLSSFVVAGAGQNVVKHGNNGVSSVCGSSNVLQQLGYKFTNNRDRLRKDMETAGICFLHAPLFHPAMKNVAPIRKELGMKTFFNMLGPLVNPTFPKKQLIGVFSLELARLYGYLLQEAEVDFAVVHGLDGYDEISLTGPFKIISSEGESIKDPSVFNFKPVSRKQIAGGVDIADSTALFMDIISGNGTEAQENVVFANAGYALYAAKHDKSLECCVDAARESLRSGKAKEALLKMIDPSK
jgi:anthranilate phosphoribosyltransferase